MHTKDTENIKLESRQCQMSRPHQTWYHQMLLLSPFWSITMHMTSAKCTTSKFSESVSIIHPFEIANVNYKSPPMANQPETKTYRLHILMLSILNDISTMYRYQCRSIVQVSGFQPVYVIQRLVGQSVRSSKAPMWDPHYLNLKNSVAHTVYCN